MNPEDGSRRCYLCGGSRFGLRPGKVRDSETLRVLECAGCGLVFLSSFDHITADFYDESGMHDTGWDLARWREESAADDERRFRYLADRLAGKRVLDFGCGNAGFLSRAAAKAAEACGVEPEKRHRERFAAEGLRVFRSADEAPGAFDLVTLFHVLEHLPDPRAVLTSLAARLSPGGRLVVEVPSADDALLSRYACKAFSEFTYWSCHLFLFTPATLRTLAGQAGLRVDWVDQVQRYPLSNHLRWLAQGKPGGHKLWGALDAGGASEAYAANLAASGQCDTLVAGFSAP